MSYNHCLDPVCREYNKKRNRPPKIIFSFVCQRNYSRASILSKKKKMEESHLERRKSETKNLHKLITFTVVTCDARNGAR